jgi:hypothetical protein
MDWKKPIFKDFNKYCIFSSFYQGNSYIELEKKIEEKNELHLFMDDQNFKDLNSIISKEQFLEKTNQDNLNNLNIKIESPNEKFIRIYEKIIKINDCFRINLSINEFEINKFGINELEINEFGINENKIDFREIGYKLKLLWDYEKKEWISDHWFDEKIDFKKCAYFLSLLNFSITKLDWIIDEELFNYIYDLDINEFNEMNLFMNIIYKSFKNRFNKWKFFSSCLDLNYKCFHIDNKLII